MSHESKRKVRTDNGAKAVRPDFNVVIAYDEKNAASRAMNIFSGLVRQFGDDFEFRCDLWRFDVLGLPLVRKAAARAGDAADLLIVSAAGDIELPAPVRDWLNWCVEGKPPGSAALVALLETHCGLDEVQDRTRQFLQGTAGRNRMDFFLHDVSLTQARQRLAPQALERGRPLSPVLQRIIHREKAPPRLRKQDGRA